MKINRRAALLVCALLASVAAALAVSKQGEAGGQISDAVERPASAPVTGKRSKEKAGHDEGGHVLAVGRLRRDALSVGEQNPFAPKSWYVPPPAPPAPPAEKPGVPPLPFTYVGRLDEADGKWTIYLARGTQSYVVQQGDTLENTYRVENIEGGSLIIRYLPMDTKQTLQIGEAL